jgi:tyrosinase
MPESRGKKTYQEAADKLRLPYWDWAVDPQGSDGCMPSMLRNPMTRVSLPDGTVEDIPNPLFEYKFQGLKADEFPLVSPCK